MVSYAKLTAAGIDMKSLLDRLMGNDLLIRVFIKKFTEDKNFEALVSAFEVNDMNAAETASHTLKGMCGNLSLSALFELFGEQTNLIRWGSYSDAEAMMDKIAPIFEGALGCMKEWLAENQ